MLFSIRNKLKFLHVSSGTQKPLSNAKGRQILINPPVSGSVFENSRLTSYSFGNGLLLRLDFISKDRPTVEFQKENRHPLHAVCCMYIVQEQLVRAFLTRFFAILLVHYRFSV
jgi:hypothetical protein